MKPRKPLAHTLKQIGCCGLLGCRELTLEYAFWVIRTKRKLTRLT